jgi:aminoglycoside phosphotransferase (APT) family kinase protein
LSSLVERPETMTTTNRSAIAAGLARMGLWTGLAPPPMEPLTGGVSSDIWRVYLADGPVCVKRALARLKVAQVWEAPVERNASEWHWFTTVAKIVPDAVPRPIAEDREGGMFAMAFLDPAAHPVWKMQLRDGIADPLTARAIGERLATIHAATAGHADVAATFATDAIFEAIRLEPYLRATARAHPDLAEPLNAMADATARTKLCLVHGDVSPKNILVGPHGPVFLDAECAWHGDPAFDLAFCLNHLLLKCLWNSGARAGFFDCFDALATAYLSRARWEPREAIEGRAARLLPGLFLARVDGKSPVEYITAEAQRECVRRAARPLIARPPERLAAIAEAWKKELTR